MGTVFRAFDLMLEREVAVKLMRKELAEDTQIIGKLLPRSPRLAALNHTNSLHLHVRRN